MEFILSVSKGLRMTLQIPLYPPFFKGGHTDLSRDVEHCDKCVQFLPFVKGG